jgi:hypothetical protein
MDFLNGQLPPLGGRTTEKGHYVDYPLKPMAALALLVGVFGACTALGPRASTPLLEAEERTCSQVEAPYGCGTYLATRGALNRIRSQATYVPGLPPVAVFDFRDTRGEAEPTRVGTAVQPRATHALHNDEPVASTVSRFVTVALLSRGFPVVDRRRSVYEPHKAPQGERFAITGDIPVFWVTHSTPGRHLFFNVRVQLRVYDTDSGALVWEKLYSTTCAGLAGWDPCSWPTVLETVFTQVVKDPELVDHLARK